MDTMSQAFAMAFRTALLLTGGMKTAEAAVMHGIGACEDFSPRGLLTEAVRSAVQRCKKSSGGPHEVEGLPFELRRLFMLQPLLRYCFVLRILVGLPPEVCAELLEISVSEFENALYGALTELPSLYSKSLTDPKLTAVDDDCLAGDKSSVIACKNRTRR